MKQRFHTIIKPEPNGWFVGWVEEVPGTISQGRSLDECRANLKQSLLLMLETHRDDARQCLDESCIEEPIEVEVEEPAYHGSSGWGHPGTVTSSSTAAAGAAHTSPSFH
jgi:predicted RNase H-like HicB family nuclease